MDASEQLKTPDTLAIALLVVATIAALGLLLLEAINSGSPLAWSQVPIPLVLAGGMGHLAVKAHRRGEHSTARAVLSWAAVAVGLLGVVASRLGG